MLFTDQVELIATWFKDWNECEQTVALYSLLKRVKKCQAKFLLRCLEHFLNDCQELQPIEQEANDHEYISHLFNKASQSEVIEILLSHLPLLRPGNDIAKNQYLTILPKILQYAVERSEFLEESRELLTYSLIHPAFDVNERHMLTTWMSSLDGQARQNANTAPENPSQQQQQAAESVVPTTNGIGCEWPPSRHPADQPVVPSPADPVDVSGMAMPSVMSPLRAMDQQQPTLPAYQSSAAPPPDAVSPQVISPNNVVKLANGMADVQPWLKSLRLHKYSDLFAQMTYQEMMDLTPDKLDEKNVTKGARNKIILSIKKLHERFSVLQSLEKDILGGGSLKSALIELKTMIQTPIKHFESQVYGETSSAVIKREVIEDGDIPSQFTKVMGKACTQLLVSKPDEENITLYMRLLEKCIQHPAFTDTQKRRLRTWKQQVNKMYRSLPRNMRPLSAQQRSSHQALGYPGMQSRPVGRTQFAPHMSNSAPRQMNLLSSPQLRSIGMGFQPQQNNSIASWYQTAMSSSTSSQTSLDSSRRAASLDPRLGHRMFGGLDDDVPSEINTRLDSLCLSVAEHALSDGVDGASTL